MKNYTDTKQLRISIREGLLQGAVILALLFFGIYSLKAQGLESTNTSETEEQEGFWIGHVYEGEDNFTGERKAEVVEMEMFDESFARGEGTLSDVRKRFKTFSIRYKMTKTFTPGLYQISVGSDTGLRFSVDGGQTYLINEVHKAGHYKRENVTVYLKGSHDLVLEYFNHSKKNRVSFDYTYLGKGKEEGSRLGKKQHKPHYKKHQSHGPFPHDDSREMIALVQMR